MTSYLFTMADMESHADFARRRGSKDKSKRKSRAGLYAGIGAGVVATGGVGTAGYRYGGAYLQGRKKQKDLNDFFKKKPGDVGTTPMNKAGMLGVQEKLAYDKRAAGRWLGNPLSRAKAAYNSSSIDANRARSSLKGGKISITSTGSLGNRLRQTGAAARSVMGTNAGRLGAGALGVGALAGGGYAGYRALKNRKKKK